MGNKIIIYFLIILFLMTKVNMITITYLTPTQGILNITYNSTESKLYFQIPLSQTFDTTTLIHLNLSEPLRVNRTNCICPCNIISNIMYCEIDKSYCELLFSDSAIRINSIEEDIYDFSSYHLLTSEINYEISTIEMTCSNFKLSFFFYNYDLNKHPYQNIDFTIPVYYRDKEIRAICILPKNGIYIPCVIDATRILFEKDYTLDFDINNPIKLTDDLSMTLSKIKGYKLEDDCGKEIDWAPKFLKLNSIINLILLFLFLLF